ncbi:MAG: single-stranded-DNA-specific exonuclease RecJ [Spirochaetaceae bacterium]|jgi:single-stranded-DNA-specific exonuclease|nr:single-stranded-DNA-specific exonuclease RecJ [Spirochaetaceae bacterium]
MKWNKRELDVDLVNNITEKYTCDKLTASILARRGLFEPADILYFLEDDKRYLHNPFLLSGMEEAVEKILDLKDEGGKVLVFGDRDVDGVTGAAMLVRYLQNNGIDVCWRIPVGDEPYGLSINAVEEFAHNYGSLIITVDCGITNHKEIERAGELGIDVIVTDHHEPRNGLPGAFALINPKIKDENGVFRYPFQGLAGCAVVYKLIQALDFAQKSSLFNQQICLLNCRPGNDDTWIVELKKIRNLVEIGAMSEILTGSNPVSIARTRLPAFLEGQHIYTWDAPLQKKSLKRIFGQGIEFGLFDIAEPASQCIPSTAGKSLVRLKEMSRLGRYEKEAPGELDVLFTIFRSVFQKTEHFFEDEDTSFLQLTALGSIADMMNLENENRILVRRGLAALNEKALPGLSALMFKLNLTAGQIGAWHVAWTIAPAINSAGRLGDASCAVQLLLEDDFAKRDELAGHIAKVNEERKKSTAEAQDIALPLAEKNSADFSGKLAFAASEKISRGITGLVAGRLASCMNIPAVVVSLMDGTASGSIRSAQGYNVQALLNQISDLCVDCGGHEFAAGFLLEMGQWADFTSRLKDIAYALEFPADAESESSEILNIDAELPLPYLTPGLFKMLDVFEPFGRGWPEFLFLTRGLKILDITLMGRPEAKHAKLTLDAGKHKWPALYWDAADKAGVEWQKGDTVDAVFKLTRNHFGGKVTPQLVISDMRVSAAEREKTNN